MTSFVGVLVHELDFPCPPKFVLIDVGAVAMTIFGVRSISTLRLYVWLFGFHLNPVVVCFDVGEFHLNSIVICFGFSEFHLNLKSAHQMGSPCIWRTKLDMTLWLRF